MPRVPQGQPQGARPAVGQAAASSAGCALGPKAAGFFKAQRIVAGGRSRTFAFTLPRGYDGARAYPLVFVFHGDGGTGEQVRGRYALESASNDGAVFVYPDGEGRSWKQAEPESTGADFLFFDELAAMATSQFCVDTSRVFATGFSSGGYMANQLACARAGTIRAVAPVAGGGPYDAQGKRYDARGELTCRVAGGVNALVIWGSSDTVVRPSEGQKAAEHWRKNAGCPGATLPRQECADYAQCASGRRVSRCELLGVGHDVPARVPTLVWEFFASL